jgi:hypothetical protein
MEVRGGKICIHTRIQTHIYACTRASTQTKANFRSFLGRKVAKYVDFEVAKVVTVMSDVL